MAATSMTLPVALLQLAVDPNPDQQAEHIAAEVRAAAAAGAKLVVLPELHDHPYLCQHESAELFDLAEPIPGPSSRRLAALAAELDIVLVGSIFERRAAGLYHNTAVVFDGDRGQVGLYRKLHIPDDPGYYEKHYFTPGDTGCTPIDTSVGRLGVLVCWDQWFPEAARLMALAGAELLIYPTAIGYSPEEPQAERDLQAPAWELVQRGHAVANGLPVLTCNRVGFEPDPSGATAGIEFWGRSFIAGPQGEWLARATTGAGAEPERLTAEIDLQRSENVRRIWPFLRDRRIDAYADLTRRFID